MLQPEPRTLSPKLPFCSWLALCGILAVFVLFRARGIGHLLIWDEAMDLAAVRAFVTSSRDAFSNAFWAHPPLFPLMMTWLDPLRAGFAERCQGLAIAVQALNLVLLFLLNRRLFGTPAALLGCAVLACLPGAVFFDAWIKRDHLVVTFGLLSLLALGHGRVMATGVLLGAALLSKESALFYVAAVLLLTPRLFPGRTGWKNLAGIASLAAVTSGWWYAYFDIMGRTYLRFALGRDTTLTGWNQPWTYYLERAWNDLGPAAVVLLAAGIGAATLAALSAPSHGSLIPRLSSLFTRHSSLFTVDPPPSPLRFWPPAVLVPAYLYLGLARGKAPWLTMVLYPAWATAIGWAGWQLARRIGGGDPAARWRRCAAVAGLVLALAALGLTTWRRDYAAEQERLGFGQRWGSSASRQAAETLNGLVKPGERVLITPFWYWGDDSILTPCPIFSYYLNDMPVLLRSFHLTPEEFIETVRRHRIHWAMLSPPPGTGEAKLLNPLINRHNLQPQILSGCIIFRADGLWETVER